MSGRLRAFTLLLWLLAPLFLWLALRNIDWEEAWRALTRLGPWQVSVLVLLNLAVLSLITGRWWFILRVQGHTIPYRALYGYRLASFAVSYFTPGAQFGGEPLQVYLLHQRHGLNHASALASVTLDKLFEILANFGFLALGFLWIVERGFPSTRLPAWWNPGPAWSSLVLAAGLFLALSGYLAALRFGRFPLMHLSLRLAAVLGRRSFLQRLATLLITSERYMAVLLRHKPWAVVGIALLSGLIWVLIIAEYWITLRFLGLDFDLFRTIAALTAARLAFLTPLPAGAGALEAGQSFALRALGANPALGLSISLVIRARDILLGLIGLALVARYSHLNPRLARPADPTGIVEGGIGDESSVHPH